MELINLKGNTFYVRGGTNTGVYIENNKAFIIDPGLSGLRPNKIVNTLRDREIDLEFIINTHEHRDHYVACHQIKEHYPNIDILSSEDAKIYIDNPNLFSSYVLGGRNNNFMKEKVRNRVNEVFKVDNTVYEGKQVIKDIELEIISLKGHTQGSIGIITKDKILFVGDLLIEEDILSKYDFLLMYDVHSYLESLEKIRDLEFEYMVLGHGRNIISKQDSYELIEKHRQSIYKYINQIKKELLIPIGIDKLLKNIIINNDLKHNYKEYHFFRSSLISIISYLADLKEIEYLLHEGELLYYTKKK